MIKIADTPRLSFRLMNADDAELLFELDQDPEVMKYITGGKMTTMEKIMEVYVPRMESYTNPEKGWGIWKTAIRETNEYIGWILTRPMNFFSDQPEYDNLEIGWRLKRQYWGNGYATEGAKAIMDGLLGQRACRTFSAIAMQDNMASINIMKKVGMEYVKTYIHKDPIGDMECVYYECPVTE